MLLHESGFKSKFPRIRTRAASSRESKSEPVVNEGVLVLSCKGFFGVVPEELQTTSGAPKAYSFDGNYAL